MQLTLGVREAIEAIVIISVFGTTGYAVHRLRNQRKPAADVSRPGPAIMAAFFRSCWKWVAGLLTLVLVVVLALVRGITSGGGIFSPELDKVQVCGCGRNVQLKQQWLMINVHLLRKTPIVVIFKI